MEHRMRRPRGDIRCTVGVGADRTSAIMFDESCLFVPSLLYPELNFSAASLVAL